MSRGTYRRVAAVSMLAICLTLAVPQSADAGLLTPGHPDQAESVNALEQEATFWQTIWNSVSSYWERASVMIDPSG